jgi:aminoglycoside phosphotransferase (APT) family kinase protein
MPPTRPRACRRTRTRVMEETEVLQRLSDWLSTRGPANGPPMLRALGKPGSGYSAENLVIEAQWTDGSVEKLVLRRDTPEPPIYPAQTPGTTTGILLQHTVMDVLRDEGRVPVAQSLGLESDSGLLGAPFFVMRHVAGDVPAENPPYTRAGFFVEASPEQRSRLVSAGLVALARVHETRVEDPRLAMLGATEADVAPRRQLEVWEDSLREGLAGRSSPLFEDSLGWLHDQMPSPASRVLSWGDARPGNMIWQDFGVACITDFEGAAVGPRELDVGWWLMFDRWMHERSDVGRLAGEPDRAEQRAMYERAAGTSIGSTIWYEVFSALRFAVTVVQVMNRSVARGMVPEDQTIWRDNPATEVLGDLLREAIL